MPFGTPGVLAEAVVRIRADQQTLRREMGTARSYFTGQVRAMQQSVRGMFSPLRSMLGLGGGIAAVSLVKKSLSLAVEQERAERKLEAVLRATGGAAGYSAAELKRFAAELQNVTNYGDETTIGMMGVLATFKNIRGPMFKDTVRSIQDIASVMETDLRSAAVQVGKAMNDPIQGVTALTRVGVSFSSKQKEMIKSLVASNKLFEAQRIILLELQSEFGGAARAMADPFTQLMNVAGDFGERVGQHLLPYAKDFARELIIAFGGRPAVTDATKARRGAGGMPEVLGEMFGYAKTGVAKTEEWAMIQASFWARVLGQKQLSEDIMTERKARRAERMGWGPREETPAFIPKTDWAEVSKANRDAIVKYITTLWQDLGEDDRKRYAIGARARGISEMLYRGVGLRAGLLTAGLTGLGFAARAARPYQPEPVGRGGFTGIAELSRTLQMGIFGDYQQRMQEKQTQLQEEIAKNTGDQLEYLKKTLEGALSVFGVGAG